MSDFETLRSRVEEAADMLAVAEADRHHHSESLSGLLARLEEKFDAQRQELAFYKQRVQPLESINHDLADLMDRLLTMIDRGFGEASVAPLRDAAAAAARILDTGEDIPAPDVASVDEPGDEVETVETSLMAETGETPEDEGRFEDVGIDALLAEAELEADCDTDADMPAGVAEAHIAAISEDDPLAEVLEAIAAVDAEAEDDMEGPDDVIGTMESLARRIAADSASHGGDAGEKVDIRSLLARVEAAVEEVRERAKHDGAPAEAGNGIADMPRSAVA